MTINDIPGYFDFHDVYDAAVKRAEHGDVLIELGVMQGRSLAHLALAAEASGKALMIYGVDRFVENNIDAVRGNLNAVGAGNVQLIKSDTAAAAARFNDGVVNFLYLDADHSYEGVQRDIVAWLPKMAKGGVMAGHDCVRDPVHRAVCEAFQAYHRVGPLSWVVRL